MKILRWKNIAGKAPFHAARASLSRSRPLADHGHDFAEVFWIDAGRGMHRINGDSIPLVPGSLVLMRATDCHGINPTGGEELKLTNIAFPGEALDFHPGPLLSAAGVGILAGGKISGDAPNQRAPPATAQPLGR